jgi:hypothetical protein
MKQLYQIIWIICLLSMALLFSAPPDPAYAATINVDGATCTLADAITSANDDTATGGCSGGSGADVLNLTNNINLTAVLPDITSDITIESNGYTIAGNNSFRILTVAGSGTLTLNNATVTNGAALGGFPNNNGGGILVNSGGTATLNNSTITSNSASANGGGVHCNICALNLNNSTMSANTARVGGGINVAGASTVTVFNSTISGNSADDNGGGIAKAFGDGTISINFSTITNNTADSDNNNIGDGGGIFANSNTTIQNSIVQGNFDLSTAALADCNSSTNVTSNGYNVVGLNTGCPTNGTGDITAAANLGPLQDNGGPTFTHMPGANSAAIDRTPIGTHGCGVSVVADQRGVSRAQDGDANNTAACDSGAVEYVRTLCSVTTGVNYTYGEVVIHFDDLTSTNLACLSVEYVDGNHPNATSSGSNDALETGRYWRINGFQNDGVTPATGTFQVDVTLPYAGADGNSRACKWLEGVGPGFGWDCGTNLDNSASAGVSVTRNNYTGGFSDWAAGDNVGPTAVTFQTFTAVSQQSGLAIFVVTLLTALSGVWLWTRRWSGANSFWR